MNVKVFLKKEKKKNQQLLSDTLDFKDLETQNLVFGTHQVFHPRRQRCMESFHYPAATPRLWQAQGSRGFRSSSRLQRWGNCPPSDPMPAAHRGQPRAAQAVPCPGASAALGTPAGGKRGAALALHPVAEEAGVPWGGPRAGGGSVPVPQPGPCPPPCALPSALHPRQHHAPRLRGGQGLAPASSGGDGLVTGVPQKLSPP